MYIPEINISFMKFYDIGVVKTPQYFQFLFQWFYIFFNVGTENALYSIHHLRITDAVSKSYGSKIAAANKSFEFVNLTYVEIRVLFFDVLECLLTRTRTANSNRIGLCLVVLRARLLTYYCRFLLASLIWGLVNHLCIFVGLTLYRRSIP